MSLGFPPTGTIDTDEAVAELVEELANRLQAGEPVNLEAFIGQHPQHADQLRRLLPAVRVLADLGKPASDRPEASPQDLGDFRLLREVGRGGMGVVYEAEQRSLRRRVAVKVLPFAAVLDHRQLNRFHNEARAAALLQHPNIVPVYAVGHEQGVHFYAMQLVAGRTLAAVIAGLRRQVALTPPADGVLHHKPDFFRAVARLGVQAAEALEHAHQQDVIHRDVKPGNLLVEDKGKLWVADFGLASVKGGGGLTSTGDLVGTLRYMSPEQVQSHIVDHRTDIYSLGVTLYEVLALAPAFPSDDRQELLRRVALEEPAPLRRLNPATPPELQVIVGKAMAKDPGERYATAGALAEDLQRFLDDRPIRARPPSWRQRARHWARRRRSLVVSLSVSAVLLLAGTLLASILLAASKYKAAKESEQKRQEAVAKLEKAEIRLHSALLSEAGNERRIGLPGYRKRVWKLLHAALELPVENKDFARVRAEVLASVGDPIGLEPVPSPVVVRRKLPKTPWEFVWFMVAIKLPAAAPRAVAEDGSLLAWSRYNGVVEVRNRTKGWGAASTALGAVYDLQFTPDGATLVASCEEGVVTWLVPDKMPKRDFAHEGVHAVFRIGNASSVAVDPSGQMVATVCRRQIELWSLTTSRHLASWPTPANPCQVEFSADGMMLLATSKGEIFCGWKVRETPEKRRLWGHDVGIPAVAFSPDGRLLASVAKDFSLRLWDAKTGEMKRTCKVHGGGVEAVEFSPDGKLVATGDFAGGVRLFDVRSGRVVAQNGAASTPGNHLQEAPGQVWRLRFSPRGDRIAVAGGRGLVVWTVQRKGDKIQLERLRTLLPSNPPPTVRDVVFHPGGDILVFLDGDRHLFSADLRDKTPPRRLDARTSDGLRMLDFDAAGKFFTFVSDEGRLCVWDWHKGVVRRTEQTAHHMTLGDSRWVAVTGQDRSVEIFDLRAGKLLLALPQEQSDIWGLAWSPDCRQLAVCLSDGGLAVWDLEEVRARLKEFGIHSASTVRRQAVSR